MENPAIYGFAPRPTSASLRRVIDAILLTDAELEAFCVDYFPEIQKRFSDSMERRIKVTLLLEQENRARVVAALKECCPQAFARHGHLIRTERVQEGELDFSNPNQGGLFSRFNDFCEAHPALVPWLFMGGFFLLMSLISWLSRYTY